MWIRNSDVVQWADDWILRIPAPRDWLLHVSLTKESDDPIRLCEELARADGITSPEGTAADILPLFARELHEHPVEWSDLIARVHQLLQDHLSPLALPGQIHSGVLQSLQLTAWQFADERAYGNAWYREEGARAALQSDLGAFELMSVPTFLTSLPSLQRFTDCS